MNKGVLALEKGFNKKQLAAVETPEERVTVSPAVVNYFRLLSRKTGVPYKVMIDLYLIDCVKSRRKIRFG